jgi:hypothetical protein
MMRTTVTFDDDVASVLRPLLAKGRPKEVMNQLLRQALGIHPPVAADLPVFNLGLKPGYDPVALNKLAEDEALSAELRHLGS